MRSEKMVVFSGSGAQAMIFRTSSPAKQRGSFFAIDAGPALGPFRQTALLEPSSWPWYPRARRRRRYRCGVDPTFGAFFDAPLKHYCWGWAGGVVAITVRFLVFLSPSWRVTLSPFASKEPKNAGSCQAFSSA